MVKKVVWTKTAKNARKEILQFWVKHNQSDVYSKKVAQLFRRKVKLLQLQNYVGKPTDFADVRATLVDQFTLFYKTSVTHIIIVGIWDNRRNPDDLRKNLEL